MNFGDSCTHRSCTHRSCTHHLSRGLRVVRAEAKARAAGAVGEGEIARGFVSRVADACGEQILDECAAAQMGVTGGEGASGLVAREESVEVEKEQAKQQAKQQA